MTKTTKRNHMSGPISRREFGAAAAAAVVAPVVWHRLGQQAEAPKPEPKLKLTTKQEEDVKKATDRREEQLSLMRSRALPFDLEPAFVFAARPKARKRR